MFARPPSIPSVRGRGRTAPLAAVALLVAATFAPAAPAFAEPKLGRVQKLEAREDGSRTVVTIHGTATPTFTVYKLEKPERVVVDIANAELGVRMDGPVAINTWAVGQLAAQELGEADAAVTRVIVQLARPSTYQVKAAGTDVVVTVTPREPKPTLPIAVDEASRADAQAARAEASKAKAEADRAKADASAAKADASAAKADASAAKAEAEAARAQANAAKADAEQTKRAAAQRAAEADKRLQTADERLRAADARMAQADAGLREADVRKKQAEAAQKQAERALADADQRGKVADGAARAAEKQRAAAERAAAEAAASARRAEAAGDADAARKRQEAEAAAARADARRQEAEARRQEAEAAAARADARRQDAERARVAAESSRSQAEQAKQDAQREKQLAERDRDRARSERDAAEKARLAAQKARVAEEQRTQAVAEKRAQEEERTRAAEGARGREEQAARAAGEKRQRAEAARVEAEGALASVQARRADAEKARVAAEGRARDADKAAREAEAVARAKGKQSEEWKRADERARALEERQRAAETELAQRKRALADEQVNADRAAAERDAAVAAAGAAKSEAEKARVQRQAEEKRKAQVEAERIVEEKKLAEAKRARVVEEGKLAVAERKRRDSEAKAIAEQQRREAEAQAAEQKHAAAEAKAIAEQQRREAEAQVAEQKRAAAEQKRAVAEQKRAAAEQKQREAEELAARKAAPAPAPVAAKAAPAPAPVAAKAAPAPAPVAAKAVRAPAPVAAKAVRVANVDYVDRDRHARVVVQLSGPAEPQVIASSGRQAILSIPGADIPASLERSLDTSEFSGPVTAISSYRDPRDPGRVRIVVDLAEPAQAKLVRAGNTWYWDFEKPAAVARSSARPKRPAGAPAARAVAYEPPVIGGYGAASTPVTSQTVAQKKKVYRGKRIDLDFKDADLHNLLRLLAQVGDVNIVIPDDVKASVTVRLTDVPWDQAMEVILQSKGLWYRREGRLIRVADRKLLDAEDEEERARKRALIQEESPESVIFTLNYSVAEEVGNQARTLLSPKGKLEVDKRTNSLVITDVKANRSRIIDLLTQLDTQTPQIQIEARIVEARSTWSREIGVQWGFNALASAAGGNPTGLIFPSSVGAAGGATDNQAPTGGLVGNPDFAVNLPATVGTGAGGAVGFNFGSVGGNFNLQLRLSAAEEQGAVRIVSAPKITVLNNIEAEISQGVSIPIQVVSASGAQTSFVQADLKLTVTPHVSQRDCSIQLEVEVTKNEPDFVNTGARGDPSILTKVAKTTMLIGDGETSVIGGIYTRNTGKSYSKVPFFGDIPILGFFFRQKRENDDRTEVLIFLSPKITNKASLRCEGRAAN